MNQNPKNYIIVAGEVSGDMLAADLVRAIQAINPEARFSGLGGEQMRQAGVGIYADLTQLAVVGTVEVIKHFKPIKAMFDLILHHIKTEKPDAIILVDYPGFNLRLAKKVKELGIKVFFYVSPQVWAWKKNRVFFIQKYIDKMMVFFEFEKQFYAQHGVEVEWVGHPIVDLVKVTTPRETVLLNLGLNTNQLTLGLLPGSRHREIESLLPPMLKACSLLGTTFPQLQFMVIKAYSIPRIKIQQYLNFYPKLNIKISEQGNYNSINACDVCLVASGTATLETALLEKPMVIMYKTNWLTWILGKMLVKIKHLGLPNIIAGKTIVSELLQNHAKPSRITREVKQIITNEIIAADMITNLKAIKTKLDHGGAAKAAAQVVCKNS